MVSSRLRDAKDGPDVENGSSNDARDMRRMAYSSALHRRFTLQAIVGFACILGATWEYALVTSQSSLINGGTGGLIWMSLAVILGMFCVQLSLAEMASIAPSSGGQYHWVSELAPENIQRLLSYFVGWFTAIGWQASLAGTALIIAQHIEALIVLQNPHFEVRGWMTSLLMIAAAASATLVNIYGLRLLPWLEMVMFTCHCLGFFAVLVPLWLMGERSSAHDVFFTFQDNSGWGSIGVACLVGVLGPTATISGGDSACHLGEETNNASKAIPIGMVVSAVINYIVGFIMTLAILFVSGNFDEELALRIGESYIAVIYAATQSKSATIILTVLVLILFFCCTINTITTASRQLFSFARDGGMPYSKTLSKVNHKTGLPTNSLLATFSVTFVLSWISCGSTIAFQTIVSISLVGILLSYGTTIATMIYRRWSGVPLPLAYWRYSTIAGYIINALGLCFITIAFVFVFFPTAPNPSAASMNWSIVVTSATVIVATIHYILRGKKNFEGPVKRIRREGSNN